MNTIKISIARFDHTNCTRQSNSINYLPDAIGQAWKKSQIEVEW
jgi:hypothetical protein